MNFESQLNFYWKKTGGGGKGEFPYLENISVFGDIVYLQKLFPIMTIFLVNVGDSLLMGVIPY